VDAASSTFSTIDVTAAGAIGNYKYQGAPAVLGTTVYFAPYNQNNVGLLALPAPPSPPPPSPPQPSSPVSAGDDPTFVGADAIPYEVRGEPWRNFNLVSAPRLSINAQFLPVPDRFVHGKITDTVLGTLHIATCNASSGRTVGVLFDVFDGVLKCTLRGPLEQVPCAAALAAAGVTVRREVSGCRLATMECGLILEEDLAAIEAEDASFVRVHMERFNISLASGARLSFVRDLVDSPDPEVISQFDCSQLKLWPRAARACNVTRAYYRDEAPLAAVQDLGVNDRVASLAVFNAASHGSKRLHFHNIHIHSLAPYTQHEVHGVLGQRAISPAPMTQPPVEQPGGGEGQRTLAALDTTTFSAALGLGGGGVGTSTTVRAAVQVDGRLQGEGAIVGSYRDYQVKWVSSHGPGAFAYSRFTKCAGD